MTPEEHKMLVSLVEGQESMASGLIVIMILTFIFWIMS